MGLKGNKSGVPKYVTQRFEEFLMKQKIGKKIRDIASYLSHIFCKFHRFI